MAVADHFLSVQAENYVAANQGNISSSALYIVEIGGEPLPDD